MKFLDVKTDYAFKKVFGSDNSKSILLSFLNSLDIFNGQDVIEDLTIVDPYQVPLIQGMKDTYVDVKATLSSGAKVIIEMQVLNVPGFEQRILYNAAKSYSTQLLKGEHYHLLNPVIALTITDFAMFVDTENYKSTFKLIEKDRLVQYNGDIELVFIELPKFNKTESELANVVEKWIYFIKNAGSLAYIPETLAQLPELSQAFTIANEAGLSLEELEIQFKRKDFIILQRDSIALAASKALEKGREEGREEGIGIGIDIGIDKGKFEVLQRLMARGMSADEAAESTGLDVNQWLSQQPEA
jgi:predicted transposase/invertase (TIGR01784 family)